MPFGFIFGAFFFLFCGWIGVQFVTSGETSSRIGGLLLICLGLALAAGLLTRRGWARWMGLFAALGMMFFGAYQVDARGTALDFAVVLGGFLTAALLLLKNTGQVEEALARPSGGVGKLLGWTTALSALGLIAVAGTSWVDDAPGAVSAQKSLEVASLGKHVRWKDFGAGVELARSEGKPILVTFETTWCGYCKKMDQTTWKDPSVVARMAELVPVKVNTEDGRTLNGFSGVQLAGQYQISGTPTTMLVDAEGRVLSRSSGYQTPRQFLSWLEGSLGAGRSAIGGTRTASP